MRWETFLVNAPLLGMVSLDFGLEIPVLLSKNKEELERTVRAASIYFGHNMSTYGVVPTVVTALVVISVGAFIFRLYKERKPIDFLHLISQVAMFVLFSLFVAPLEEALPREKNLEVQRLLVVRIFLGHVFLAVALLFSTILHLLAAPPKTSDLSDSRLELFLMWIGGGMLYLDLSFDLPLLLNEKADLWGAFINNTVHIKGYVHLFLLPVLVTYILIVLLGRTWSKRNVKDFIFLGLFLVAAALLFAVVEPHEKSLSSLSAPLPSSLHSLRIIGASHLAIQVLVVVLTAATLAGEGAAVVRAAPKKKMK